MPAGMNAQAGAAAHRPAALSTLEAGPVRLPLDEAGLLDYLLTALPPGSLPRSCVLAGLRQFGHGQSNPTYLALLASADAPERVVSRLVVRRKPPGKILESAHAVEREYAAISALAGAVPVPRAMVLCSDASVLGTPFYVMEHACGHVYLVRGTTVRGHMHHCGECLHAVHKPACIHSFIQTAGLKGAVCTQPKHVKAALVVDPCATMRRA
eukprot:366301-Chlamydomonas_euryale.AAC.30